MIKRQIFDYNVTCVIMGGGAGTRLFPLTYKRAKPAVPLGGKFRLIDIPISNCINSGLNRIYILTQFNSTPLHRHISHSYHFHRFSRGFVEILAAQQTPEFGDAKSAWYQGTADAVRKNLQRLRDARGDEVLILSGDQIYQMRFQEILATHRGRDGAPPADVTIGSVLVPKEKARALGVLRTGEDGNVRAFVEKPGSDEAALAELEAPPELLETFGVTPGEGPWFLANMGIYVFQLPVLEEAISRRNKDFGKEVLPSLLGRFRVRAHPFHGYWEDIGTIRAFHQANLELAGPQPRFNFYDQDAPVYTRARLLPASKIQSSTVDASLISDGCLIEGATIESSLVGIRSVIRHGAVLRRTYVMGADCYENDQERQANRLHGVPDVAVGEGAVIENAIIDKGARVGAGARLLNRERRETYEDGTVFIREGIIVVPRDGVVPEGYEI